MRGNSGDKHCPLAGECHGFHGTVAQGLSYHEGDGAELMSSVQGVEKSIACVHSCLYKSQGLVGSVDRILPFLAPALPCVTSPVPGEV